MPGMPTPRTIVIESTDDGRYQAHVPDHPGYTAYGPTATDAEDEMRLMLAEEGERVGIVQVEVGDR